MTDEQRRKIISVVVSAVIGLVVGIAGVFGIQILSGCTSTGSADWNVEISRMEASDEV